MSQRFHLPREQLFTNLGLIGAGFKLYTYETLTTTPLATYSDTALTSANANPTIADSAGRLGDIFVNDLKLYKAVLKDADDVTIWTSDPVDPTTFSLSDFDPSPTSFWGTTSGTSYAYELTADPVILAYSSTQSFLFACHTDNLAGSTMSVNGLPALHQKKYDSSGSKIDLEDNDILGGQRYIATIDGTDIIILGQPFQGTTSVKGVRYAPSPITISNGTDADHDIDFSAGVMEFSDGSGQAVATALTKQLDATWAAGDNAGGLPASLTITNDETYHCFALSNAGGSVVDFGFDTSLTASNLLADSVVIAAGLTKYERRGSILTDSSSNILTGHYSFRRDGSYEFTYATKILDQDGSPPTTFIDKPISTPAGISVKASLQGLITETGSAPIEMILKDKLGGGEFSLCRAVSSASSSVGNSFIYTDTNSTIQIRESASNSNLYRIWTKGWIDNLL